MNCWFNWLIMPTATVPGLLAASAALAHCVSLMTPKLHFSARTDTGSKNTTTATANILLKRENIYIS